MTPVQVRGTNWRCRRAKIKRLNEEDRDQVLRMRTVPEDFDNVQALHSPYGASRNIAQQHMRYPSEPGAGRASPSMTTPGFQFPPGRGPPMPAGYAPGPESGYGHGYEGQPSAMAPYPDSRHMRHGSLMGGGRLPQPMQPGQPFPESRDDPRAQASRWGGGGGPGEYPGYGHPEGHSLYRTSSQPDIGIGLYNTGGYHGKQERVPAGAALAQAREEYAADSL